MSDKKVLYIDDDPSLCELVQAVLEMEGNFNVVTHTNGDEALFQTQDFDPDLIMLDVSMPGKDGAELFKLLRERNIQCPIVFVTSYVTETQLASLKKLGAADVLVKPIKPIALVKYVNKLLDTNS